MRLIFSKNNINNPYNQLLSVLILLILTSPLIPGRLGQLFTALILTVNILVIINLLHLRNKTHKFFYIFIAFSATFLRTINIYMFSETIAIIDITSALVNLLFLSIAIVLMVKNLARASHVTSDIIKGGICIYLLVGIWFAILYLMIYYLDSQAFLLAAQAEFDPVYFSYVTLTTTGYGDIIPTNVYARMFANLESIIGVLYPSIIISRLVSLYINHEQK
jgi:hypothetical protein